MMKKVSIASYLLFDNNIMKYIIKFTVIEAQRFVGRRWNLLFDALEIFIGSLYIRGAYFNMHLYAHVYSYCIILQFMCMYNCGRNSVKMHTSRSFFYIINTSI